MRSITLRLVAALQEAAAPDVKYTIFSVLETAVCFCSQEEYVDWGVVIGQLPLLSEEGLLTALDMFYSRLQLLDTPVLKIYLDHPSLTIRMNALNIICETIAFTSHRDPKVEAKMRSKRYNSLLYLINNPERRRNVPESELEEHFLRLCHEVMGYVQTWLEKDG